ncbi:carbohydrate porin [Parasaccharibacter sp. TMW 2.1891]|uniref:carbohydrate porin n=1 Tax=Parasaccharibacter sp. TMW 2.1891 TaxID=2267836 RepID=UPI002013B5CD|nr:carbohydrate porin [Parasaccharibacter sp. TMW 2.1891]
MAAFSMLTILRIFLNRSRVGACSVLLPSVAAMSFGASPSMAADGSRAGQPLLYSAQGALSHAMQTPAVVKQTEKAPERQVILTRDGKPVQQVSVVQKPKVVDAEKTAAHYIHDMGLRRRPYSNYPTEEFGVFGENGRELLERVNIPLHEGDPTNNDGPPLPRPEALFQKMRWNEWLRDRGVVVLLDNTNEFAGAITSPRKGLGLRQGSSNTGQYGFENDIDWYKLAGIPGFQTHVIGVGRYGIPASRMFGDNVNPSQEIYGGGGNVAFHLVYFYGEETLWGGRLNIAAGRMSMDSDFAISPIYCNFMNNAFCGNPKAVTDTYTRSSYPGSSWGARIRGRPTDSTYIQVGVYFPERGIYGVQQNRSGFKFNGGTISGVVTPIEVGWEPEFGKQQLPGHYKFGFSPDTSDHYLGVYSPPNRRNAWRTRMTIPNCPTCQGVGDEVPGTGIRRNFNWSMWFLADQMIMKNKTQDTPEGGLVAFFDAYWNKPATAMRGKLYAFGLVDTGFWPARPLDTVGVSFSYTGSSSYTRAAQRFQVDHGMAPEGATAYYASGGAPLLWGSYGVQRWGSTLEATYRIHVMRGVTFAPDFQYYFHPGMQRVLKDAAMLGFKSHIQLF